MEAFVRTLAVIHNIEQINDSGFLPGVRLGYIACDTCSDATKAIHITERLLSTNGSLPIQCDYTDYRPPVKVILGARYSEQSIPIARLLGYYMVPQISCTSSAPTLSDKDRHPSFLSPIPSDEHQTLALVKLISRFSWDWIGVVYGDDDYGNAVFREFLFHAEKAGVCMAFHAVVPHNLGHSNGQIQEVAEHIRSSSAQVVLLILKSQLVKELFQEMIRTNTSRTWIASDTWSFSRNLASMEEINKVGDIFGFTFVTGENPGLKQYLQKLQPGPGAVNHFIQEYKQLSQPDADPQQMDDDFLIDNVDLTETYNERLALLTIAHALKKLLKCNNTTCEGEKNFQPWKLLEELKKVHFELDGRQLFFDETLNFMNGYDLIMWVKAGDKRELNVVGRYRQSDGEVELIKELQWINTDNNTVPQSRCSKPCAPGTIKKVFNISCCYDCTQCEEGTYTDKWNQITCQKCPNGTWSLRGWSHCDERTEMFYKWEEPYAIALVTAAGVGILLLLAILIVFLLHRKTPAVKIAGGKLCYVMIVGLSISFGSVVIFVGKPNDHLCRSRQAMYALGFTLCVSCILVRAFRTFLAFLLDLDRQYQLKKLYKPLAIVILVTVGQGLICTFWLIFDSPQVITFEQGLEEWLQCTEGMGVGFAIMHGYIGLLAFVCFLLAFKGRKVPQDFNETGNIIFSMLIYLFVWVCFIPIYISRDKLNERSIVQASAVLASSYGIIFCHFVPKCYIALCRRKKNDRAALERRLRIFSIQSTVSVFDMLSQESGLGTMDAVSIDDTIDAVNTEGTIEAVGIDDTIDAVNTEGTIEAVGIDDTIDAVNTEGTIEAVGIEGPVDAESTEGMTEALSTEDLHRAGPGFVGQAALLGSRGGATG
ncbi:G-protein coupled receptor family C group 6 member A-like [Conger conger]|uniref:G-protein coupled receptor family C group 6 member A-like n=1 Tax=Conger conger TaxID=82655 RepID=UPI002A59C5A6|nr:G-protein coupled receptor family C group 6 member A-like [Conger conger]